MQLEAIVCATTAEPDVLRKEDVNGGLPFKLSPPDVEGVVEFLVKEKNFNEERIRKVLKTAKRNSSCAENVMPEKRKAAPPPPWPLTSLNTFLDAILLCPGDEKGAGEQREGEARSHGIVFWCSNHKKEHRRRQAQHREMPLASGVDCDDRSAQRAPRRLVNGQGLTECCWSAFPGNHREGQGWSGQEAHGGSWQEVKRLAGGCGCL